MTSSWDIHELAVFSLDDLLFGVDASQIQEILRLQHPSFATIEADDANPLRILLYQQHTPIPIFDLRRYFDLPNSFADDFTGISFYSGDCLIACQVSAIQNIFPVSLRSLQPVPYILEQLARKISLWGFYEYSGEVIPLFDLGQIVPKRMLLQYRQSLHLP